MKQLLITVPTVPLAKKRHRTVPLLECLACHKKVQGMYKECPQCSGALRLLTNLSYSDSESVKYENLISFCAQQAMKAQQVEQFTGPARMRMTFLFPVPVSRICKREEHEATYHARRNEHRPDLAIRDIHEARSTCKKLHTGDPHTQRPDVDNCVKSALDGLNGVAFADDCIIVEMTARKQWSAEGKAEIIVEEIV